MYYILLCVRRSTYEYVNINYIKNIIFLIGGTYDSLKSDFAFFEQKKVSNRVLNRVRRMLKWWYESDNYLKEIL